MKNILYLIIISFIFSCGNEDLELKDFNLYPDSTNYKYYKTNNDLIKVVRFYPDSKDTAVIFFYNEEMDIKDSMQIFYDRNNILNRTLTYNHKNNQVNVKWYYKNGFVEQENIYKFDDIFQIKKYYDNGNLQSLEEFSKIDNDLRLNKKIFFNRNFKIIKDSSQYAEIITEKDTISINDSILLKFNVIIPLKCSYNIITGDFNKEFLPIKSVDTIKNNRYLYYPVGKLGKDTLRFIVSFNETPENKKKDPLYTLILLEKVIFVK